MLKDVLRLAEAEKWQEEGYRKENKEEWMKNKPRKHENWRRGQKSCIPGSESDGDGKRKRIPW